MNKNLLATLIGLTFVSTLSGCGDKQTQIEVSNPADFTRKGEMVFISFDALKSDASFNKAILNADNAEVLYQAVDTDFDGSKDGIILQAGKLASGASTTYTVSDKTASQLESKVKALGFFVPERRDDFAWENDRVAYRMYGPDMKGEAYSGIDPWTKRVEENVARHWYDLFVKEGLDYHSDRGQGMDFYHAGKSLGAGGTGFMVDGKLHLSDAFSNWKIIDNGPLRVTFKLGFDAIEVDGKKIQEEKIISLDKGTFFNKITTNVSTDITELAVTTGLFVHHNPTTGLSGDAPNNTEAKVLSDNAFAQWQGPYGEAGDKGYLGTAVIAKPDTALSYTYYGADGAMYDRHQLLTAAKGQHSVTTYSATGWSKTGFFDNAAQWNSYVQSEANKLATPLTIKIK